MNTKEKVIKYLLSLNRDFKGGILSVNINRKDFEKSKIQKIGEPELMNQLSLLNTDGLIGVKYSTGHRDLSYYITVELYSGIVHYFDNKKANKRHKFVEVVKWSIPTIISIIALIVAIYH